MPTDRQTIRVVLVWRQRVYHPLEPLQVSVTAANETDRTLVDTELEMLLEVEKGVFYTWRLKLKDVPANSVVHDAMLSASPHFHLYENVTFGKGTVYLRLFDSQGRLLSQAEDEIEVAE